MSEVSVKDDVALEALVGQVADEFLRQQAAGEHPDIEEYTARHPEAADVLCKVLASLRLFDASLSGAGEPGALATGDGHTGTLGDFRLIREVGRGGMGIVYEAEQISLNRRVALKVLPFAATMDPRQMQRFHNEARAAAGLHHTNIVPVYAVGCERSVHFYAMQFIEGQTLATLIAEQRQRGGQAPLPADLPTTPHLPDVPTADTAERALASTERPAVDAAYFRRVADLGVQAAEALDHAHQMGIVHRDVKPANLLVDNAGRVWITDFGLAQVQSDVRLTMTGDLVGTLRYMSPEQALAKRVVIDHRTDVYSLGATLYELLTLEPAFSGADRQELLRQVAFEEPRPPRRVKKAIPAELETIVLKSMEKNPLERYATAKELADDLERYLRDEPIRARRPSLVRRARKWARRHRPVVWATAVVALLAAAAGLWYWQDRAERREEAIRREAEQRAEATHREAEERRGAQEAVAEAQRLAQQARWPQARAILAQALAQLGQAAPAELRQSLELLQRELGLAELLDSIRLKKVVIVENRPYWENAEADYAAAFREAGLLRDETEPATGVAARVQASAIRPALVAALDDWAELTRDAKRRAWLLKVARQADPDPVRDRVRDPALWDDDNAKALVKLAGEVDLAALGPPLLAALGNRLDAMGEDSLPLLKAAQDRYPSDFWLNLHLANRLASSNRLAYSAEAIGYYRAAIALRPDAAAVWYNFGETWRRQGKKADAAKAWQKAIELQPDLAPAHWDLGLNLLNQGRLVESLAELKRAQELASQAREWQPPDYPSKIRAVEKLVEVEAKLPKVLRGEAQPGDAEECLTLGRISQAKSLNAAAVRFYTDAFAQQPDLADDLQRHPRYNAACAAALAGCGLGKDADGLDEKKRAALRQQALDWLRADLTAYRRLLGKVPDKAGPIARQLAPWLEETDFVGVRGAASLNRLPEVERKEWQKLWQDVEALRQRAAQKPEAAKPGQP